MGSRFLWILDNANSKSTPGKRSPILENGKRFFEYEFTRDIVQRISQKLIASSINHHILVSETAIEVSVRDRISRLTEYESSLPKLILSISANSVGNYNSWNDENGIETFYHEKNIQSKFLASIFHNRIVNKLNWKDRGINNKITDKDGNKINPYLLRTPHPSIITASGFYSNKDECLKLQSPEWREKIASAHIEAILDVEKNHYSNLVVKIESKPLPISKYGFIYN